MKHRVVRTVLLIVLALIWLGMAGLVVTLAGMTQIQWWLPTGLSFVVALVAVWPLRRVWSWITGTDKRWINIPVGLVMLTVALSSIFYAVNYFGADSSTAREEKAVISGKYSKERYRTRRTGRGRVTRGEKYYVYYLILRMEDGTRYDRQVSTGSYVKARVGDRVGYEVQHGMLGFDVIKFDAVCDDR